MAKIKTPIVGDSLYGAGCSDTDLDDNKNNSDRLHEMMDALIQGPCRWVEIYRIYYLDLKYHYSCTTYLLFSSFSEIDEHYIYAKYGAGEYDVRILEKFQEQPINSANSSGSAHKRIVDRARITITGKPKNTVGDKTNKKPKDEAMPAEHAPKPDTEPVLVDHSTYSDGTSESVFSDGSVVTVHNGQTKTYHNNEYSWTEKPSDVVFYGHKSLYTLPPNPTTLVDNLLTNNTKPTPETPKEHFVSETYPEEQHDRFTLVKQLVQQRCFEDLDTSED